MAEVELKFDSKKAEKFFKEIRDAADSVTDKQSKWVKAISQFVVKDVADHFDKQQGSTGPWPRWSINYIGAIQGRFYFRTGSDGRVYKFDGPDPDGRPRAGKTSGKMLQDTGTMKRHFKGSMFRITGKGIEWYNDAKVGNKNFPYAAAHNVGGKTLPQREFMWMSQKAMDNIAKFTARYIVKGGKK